MDASPLNPRYWEDETPDLRLNPAVPHPGSDLEAALAHLPALRGHVLFGTSGSGGYPKLVCLRKNGILTAARWVNRYLGCGPEDRWLLALPTFHVGGFGILARSRVAGGRVETMAGPWNPGEFVRQAEAVGATVTSLVPTQLHDLVEAGWEVPRELRTVVIGGGRLAPELRRRAMALGWPLRESYGMTETAAQVATQGAPEEDAGWMPVLPGWEVRVRDGAIEVRGEPLLTAYLERGTDQIWRLRDPRDGEGWFNTGDLGELDRAARLRVFGRAGRIVKILGELVDLDRLDLRLATLRPQGDAVLEPVEDARAGWKLELVTEADEASARRIEGEFNAGVAPFERITGIRRVTRLARSPLGKRLPQARPQSEPQAGADSSD